MNDVVENKGHCRDNVVDAKYCVLMHSVLEVHIIPTICCVS